jgi:two-component system OmpR family response regulator
VRVLIVEDDLRLAGLLHRCLREEGFGAEVVSSGEAALAQACNAQHDAIVLDVMLPGIDGLTTCRHLRAAGVWTPVLMLTARDAVSDRVRGLDAGADDYLVKPFSFTELLARLRALTRRSPRRADETLQAGDLRVDSRARRAWRGDSELELSPREFDLLDAFMRRPGEALSRDWLLEQAWDIAFEHRSNVVDVYVNYLREKIDRPYGRASLQTVRGAGYRLDAGDER